MSGWLFTFTLGFISSTLATVPGTILYYGWKKSKENKPMRKILNFGKDDDLVFVFTHRDHVPDALLPRTSTEDFMAINNIKTALLKIGWHNKDLVRDTNTISQRKDDERKNIISVCSSKSNSFTAKTELILQAQVKRFFRAEKDEQDEWYITDGRFKYTTKTYIQLKSYLASGMSLEDIPTKAYEDVAYITKISNPNNARNKIILIGGVRGIGTWGAAECLKKEWQQIYEKLPKKNKECDFSALIIIKYDNMDIIEIKVHEVIPFI